MANIKELHGVNTSGADEVVYPVTEASLVGSEHGTIVDEIPYMVSSGVAGVLPADMVPPVYGLQTGVSTRGGGFTMGTSPVMEYAYGVEHDITNSSTSCTRIGNMSLHASLPVQSGMRRCLLKDDGSVNYYLSDTDSTKKGDGTDAVLDGTDGMVMVEIPAHWRRFEQDGNIMRVWLSTVALPGFHFVPKCYRSAYEAAVDRTVSATPKLASVVNTSASFRGGNNNADWDGTYRSLLGMPATTISLTDFRAYARNRGTAGKNGAGWNCDVYDVQKTCWWLYAVEYANFNCQLAYNAEPTSEGYKQGGLGPGVTTLSGSNWSSYNGYCPFVPCGHTNSLGNKTGVVDYAMPDSEGGVFATVSVPSYRGLENPFGHVCSWTDGCKCNIQSADAGGVSEFFVCTDPAKFQSNDYTDYEKRGELPRKNGYVKIMMIGEYGENMPVEVGASSTTYFADFFYTNVAGSTRQRGVHFGGAATYGVDAGLSFAVTNYLASATNTAFGSRLCFLPSVEASEWYHPTGAPKVASLPLLGDEVVKTDYWSAFPVNPPYTISIIFKTGSTVYGAPQCLFSSSELSGTGIRVEINANARFQFGVGSNNRLGPTVTSNTLYCLQIVYDGTSVTFYDNGDRSSLPFTDAFTSTTFVLGNYGDGAAPFLGEIVSCHVLNYAVSAADVKALWNGGDPVRSAFFTWMLGLNLGHTYSFMSPMTLDGWMVYGSESGATATVEDGAIKCAFNSDATSGYNGGIYRTFSSSFTIGKRVRLTFKAKSSEASAGINCGLSYGKGLFYNSSWIVLTQDWAAYSFVYEIGNGVNTVVFYPGFNTAQSGFYYIKDVEVKEIGCVAEYRPSGVVGTGLTPAFSKATVTGVSTRSGGMGASDSTLAFSGDRSIEVLFTAGDQITNSSAQCVVTDCLGSESSIFLGISITGTFYLYIGGTVFYPTPSVVYRAGSRYHFVISYAKGSVANVYVNGESHGSVTTFASSENGNGLYLGYLTSTGGYPFLGVVNHARVYNYALSVDDVSALWNSGNPGEYIIPATGTLHEGCVAEYLPDRATVDAWYPSIGSVVLSAVASPRPVGDIVTGASMWGDSSGQGAPALAAVGSPSMSYAPVPAEDEIILDSGYFVTDISTAVKNVFLPQGYVPVSVTVYNGNPSDITNVSATLGNANRFAVYGATVASGSSVTGYIGNATTGGALLTRIIVNGLTSSFYIGVNATGNTSSGGMRVKVRCRYALGE